MLYVYGICIIVHIMTLVGSTIESCLKLEARSSARSVGIRIAFVIGLGYKLTNYIHTYVGKSISDNFLSKQLVYDFILYINYLMYRDSVPYVEQLHYKAEALG